MEIDNLKQDKGVAGLSILFGVVMMLFVIGLIVMIFALMGQNLDAVTDEAVSGGNVVNYIVSGALTNDTATTFANATIVALEDISCSLFNITNRTGGEIIGVGNYSIGGTGNCYVTGVNGTLPWYNTSLFNSTYSFSYNRDTVASGVIGNTTNSLANVSSWFDIFIVITAMVVLILLTVIIITAIRGSGLVGGGGGQSGGKNIGSA